LALAQRQPANDEMRVPVKVYGLLIAAVHNLDRLVELSLPDGTGDAGAIEALHDTSSLRDPRSCLAVIEGGKVPPAHVRRDGDQVHLCHLFSGG
jgi:hypothetical protein